MISDLKYAIRHLIKSPGFTVFVILTLALGIGANTAIFTVINSVFLDTLPVKNPQQLVFLVNPENHGFSIGGGKEERYLLTYPEFQDLRDRNQIFSGILAVNGSFPSLDVTVQSAGRPPIDDHVGVSMVSGNYFSVLGVNAAFGRTFTAETDKVRDANPVAVISYAYWRDRLGGDPGVLDRQIHIREERLSRGAIICLRRRIPLERQCGCRQLGD
jgi:putative ABC transport system permease protein